MLVGAGSGGAAGFLGIGGNVARGRGTPRRRYVSAVEHVNRFDLSAGSVGERTTSAGGLVAKARLTRVGVFPYAMPDGTTRRELRHPDDVFAPDSLATFPHATLTVGHPGRVDPSNWKKHTVGHVAEAKRDGNFVAGELHIQHGEAIEDAKDEKLSELSCGYSCDIDPTPGTYQGQDYDVAQKNIRINHVGMGGTGWGRMGPDVKLHLDSGCAVGGLEEPGRYVSAMTDAEKLAKAEKDAKDAKEALDAAHKVVQDAKDEASKLAAQSAKDRAELVESRAKIALLELQAQRHTEDAAQKQSVAAVEKVVQETIAVRGVAARVFGEEWKHDSADNAGKSLADLKRAIIAEAEKGYPLDLVQDGGALDAVFALVTKRIAEVGTARQDLADALGKPKVEGADKVDENDPVAMATKGLMERTKGAFKKPDRRDRRRRDRKEKA